MISQTNQVKILNTIWRVNVSVGRNNESRERYAVNTVVKENREVVLCESDGEVTRLEIDMYVEAEWQEVVIPITWGFREV